MKSGVRSMIQTAAAGSVEVITSVFLLLSVESVASASDADEKAMAICDLKTEGDRLVGRQLTLRGTVHQDVEVAILEEKGCPISVLLEPDQGAPSVMECLLSSGEGRCGGVTENGQSITVVGTLVAAPHASSWSANGKDVLWVPARMKIQRMTSSRGPQ